MPKFYMTSDDLIASIERRILVPLNQSTFSEQDFLDFATEEMNLGVVPMVISNHEDYYVFPEDVGLIANQTKYDIPYRAIGNKIKDIYLVDSGGNLFEMTRVQKSDTVSSADTAHYLGSNLSRFYVENNQVCLTVDPDVVSSAYSLRFSYYIRPNALVPNVEIAQVISVDRNTGIITVDAVPDKFLESNLDGSSRLIDFIKAKSPHKIMSYDVSVSAFDQNSTTITLDPADIPADLQMNDIIAMAGETCIPQIPSDLHVLLAHRVATRILESLGDTEGLQNANVKLKELESKSNILVTNRVDDAPKIINNKFSPLRSGLNRRRRGW